jgi:hypothetical protein
VDRRPNGSIVTEALVSVSVAMGAVLRQIDLVLAPVRAKKLAHPVDTGPG